MQRQTRSGKQRMMSLLSFPQRTLVTNALLLTLLAMITSCTAGRTLAEEENAEFFLPDAVFSDGQCQTLLAEPIPVPQVQQACAAYKKGEIDGDKWLLRLSPVLRPSRYLSQDCLVFSVYPLRPIPKDYATYSLALFPSTQYQPSEIESIRKTFFAFGNAIGKPHAAIWFQPDQTVRLVTRKEDRQSGQVDHKRSKYYCDRFGLSYNAGPYIVTTQRRPDDVREEDEKIVIQHGGIS